jgi:hypothetical protein
MSVSHLDGLKRTVSRRASVKCETMVDIDQATAPPIRKRMRLAIDCNEYGDDGDDNVGVFHASVVTNGRQPTSTGLSRDTGRNGQSETLIDLTTPTSTGSLNRTPPIDLSKSVDIAAQTASLPTNSAPTIDLSNDEAIAVELGRSESHSLRRTEKAVNSARVQQSSGRVESSDRRKLELAADCDSQSRTSANNIIDVDEDEALARELMLQEDERIAHGIALQMAANDDAMIARAMAAEGNYSARPLHTGRRVAFRAPAHLRQTPPVRGASSPSESRSAPPHPAPPMSMPYMPALPPQHAWRGRRAYASRYRRFDDAFGGFGGAGHVLGGAGALPAAPGMALNYVDRDFDADDCECACVRVWSCADT